VTIARTPGTWAAAEMSRFAMRACGMPARSVLPTSMPPKRTSTPNIAPPRTLAAASVRTTDLPTTTVSAMPTPI
jgi:hypothetical protein